MRSGITILLASSLLLTQPSFAQNTSKWALTGTQARQGYDPYLQELYWQLNDSPMQQKLRNVKPFPVGVVYYQ